MRQYAALAAWIYNPEDYDCPVGKVDYLNPQQNIAVVKDRRKIYIVCRGTSLRKDPLNDIVTDIFLGLGRLEITNRFNELERVLIPYLKQKQNVVLIGHSLGGALATEMGLKHEIESQTFNSGRSPLSRLFFWRKRHRRSREYRNAFDPVSLFAALDPHVKTSRNTAEHSISSFI